MITKQAALEFDIKLYDLFSEDVNTLREAINRLADGVDPMSLRGPLNAIVYELCGNALKSIYKRVYFKYVLEKMGMEDLPYQSWLTLFRAEVEAHRAENFAHLCRQENIFIRVLGRFVDNVFRIEIINDGVPSEIEWSRIRASVARARATQSLADYFSDDDEFQEGAGLGLPMVMVSLRGMGVDPDCFSIREEGDRTITQIDIPLDLFDNTASKPLRLLRQNKELLAITWNLFQQMDLSAVRLDLDGRVLAVSKTLLRRLGIAPENAEQFKALVPPRFVSDLFRGPQSLRVTRRFVNYRAYVENAAKTERILYNVSGYVTEKNIVSTLWQEVNVSSASTHLSEGSLTGNIRLHNIIEPYIPQLVMMKARETVELGRHELPEEVKEQTIFFADLVGFTHMTENMRPHVVVETLNMALSVMVRQIELHDGSVDKFMGDAVMAIFKEPVDACRAAIEIQDIFRAVNRYRTEAGEPPVQARIGINWGSVIMADVGTDSRKDWTALGDTVNTASRIEKNAPVGEILISDRVYQKIKPNANVRESYQLKVKGKDQEITVHVLKSLDGEATPGAAESAHT